MRINKKHVFFIFTLMFFLVFSQAVIAGEEDQVTEVNLSHKIERAFEPEVANINVEVWSQKKDLETAYSNTTNRMNNVIKALKEFEDLSYNTSTFNVNQRQIEENKERVLYYEVTTMIKVETDNLEQLGDVIERVVTIGATNIKGISYGLEHPEKAKNEVIKEGIKQIENKAEVIKESLDKESYKISKLDINDNYSIYNYRISRSETVSSQKSLPVPEISPQDVNINVNFNVKLELK
ncbi:MAG: SIMPL domain-containing protein [Halanaerobiales bacterium]